MAGICIINVSATLTLTVPDELLADHFGELSLSIGQALAEQVDAYERRHGLGYYPALDYFKDRDGFDGNLYAASEHLAWMVVEWVRRQCQMRLREPFSNTQFEQMHALAYSMPRVRPNIPRAIEALARHYSPGRVRLVLNVASLERGQTQREGYEKLVAYKLRRWLEPVFPDPEVNEAHLLEDARRA